MDVLKSLRVIDLGNFVTGPFATMMLGELGADVIKVERPGEGDAFRAFKDGLYSPQFQSHNRHKRSITLDTSRPGGVDVLKELLRTADVLVMNNRPGVAEKLGIGYEAMHRLNPRLVYCSITGFGPDGPYANRPAYDNVGQVLSSWLSYFHQGEDPRIPGPAVSDTITGIFGLIGVLGALYEREKSGLGRLVEVSMLEATIAFASEPIGQYLATGTPLAHLYRGAFSQAYILKCKDGRRIGLHMSSPEKFWQGLAAAIERPDLLQRFPGRDSRVEHYKEIGEELARIFATRTREDWEARLLSHDVPHAPERLAHELEDDPQVRHLGLFHAMQHPRYGRVKALRRAIRYDGRRGASERPPPDLGEHTEEILSEIGFSKERIAGLRSSGLI